MRLLDRVRWIKCAAKWREIGLCFLHIPKSGGSSLSFMLYGRFLGHVELRTIPAIFLRYSNIRTFAVVREPIQRFESAYNFAKFSRKENRKFGDAIPSTYLNRVISASADINDFVHNTLPLIDIDNFDYVFKPQSKFVCRANGISSDYLFHLGDMRAVENFLSEHLGWKVIIPHLNQSKGKELLKSELSVESIKIIEAMYRDDFDMFYSIV